MHYRCAADRFLFNDPSYDVVLVTGCSWDILHNIIIDIKWKTYIPFKQKNIDDHLYYNLYYVK
jgi:hypothetical protein